MTCSRSNHRLLESKRSESAGRGRTFLPSGAIPFRSSHRLRRYRRMPFFRKNELAEHSWRLTWRCTFRRLHRPSGEAYQARQDTHLRPCPLRSGTRTQLAEPGMSWSRHLLSFRLQQRRLYFSLQQHRLPGKHLCTRQYFQEHPADFQDGHFIDRRGLLAPASSRQ